MEKNKANIEKVTPGGLSYADKHYQYDASDPEKGKREYKSPISELGPDASWTAGDYDGDEVNPDFYTTPEVTPEVTPLEERPEATPEETPETTPEEAAYARGVEEGKEFVHNTKEEIIDSGNDVNSDDTIIG